MSTRAEVRHMHLIEGVPKKEVARRLGVDVKTVRRHVRGPDEYPARQTPKRGSALDAHRDEIVALLDRDPRISAKRIGRLLEEGHGVRFNERTIRRYVKEIRGSLRQPEVFVHRTHLPGETMEIDFGESWAEIAGQLVKIFYFVAVLPASNAYFAKAYRFQRTECLLDGITSAIEWFGGLPARIVFDNASMAVRKILKGEHRVEAERFHAYRAEWPLGADFCSPASGWEKGSVERGVEYVRGLCLRPLPTVNSLEELNAGIVRELELDLERRSLADGRSCSEALAEERNHLRPIPEHRPETGRTLSVTADKYAHVRIDRSTYSVPKPLARHTLTARLYHDRVEIANGDEVVATHARSIREGSHVLSLEHALAALKAKPRAAREATAILQQGLPPCFEDLRRELRKRGRTSDREWVDVLGLLLEHPQAQLTEAVEVALESGVPGIGAIRQTLRRMNQPPLEAVPVDLTRADLGSIDVAPADLNRYGALTPAGRGEIHA